MDTYGDMVTLLLCFFVLLYSISTINEQKWVDLVRVLNPSSQEVETEAKVYQKPDAETSVNTEVFAAADTSVENDIYDGEAPVASDEDDLDAEQAKVDDMMELLYQRMKEYLAQREGAEDDISVTKGDGYVFISLNNAVFFKGDSYVLLQAGKDVLDTVAGMLDDASDAIDEVEILGHTAQSRPDTPNYVKEDRFLSSNRATVVLVYLQEICSIDPARLVSIGYGQWRPVADNDTEEGRVKNRRVEILVTGLDLKDEMGDSITQYYTKRNSEESVSDSGSGGDETALSGS